MWSASIKVLNPYQAIKTDTRVKNKMCSTCDYTKYEEYEVENNGKPVMIGGKPVVRLHNTHDMLDINCDLNGKNYKIGSFTIYRCPTCGCRLY